MLVYTYITPELHHKKIKIELLDYYFVNRWTNYLQKLSTKCPNISWYVAGLNGVSKHRIPQDNVLDLLRIRDCFVFVNKHGLESCETEICEIERLLVYPEQVLQYHLNEWHRMFTKLEHRYIKIGEKIPSTVDYNEVWQTIQDINTYTHHLEQWTYIRLPRRQEFKNTMQYSIQFTNANNLHYLKDQNDVFGPENIEFIEPGGFDFLNYINHTHYDSTVWLHEDITGKDQIKAWLDHDDLDEFDVTGNLLMTPSVTLDPYKIYSSVLNKHTFRNQSKNTKKTLDRYPLGNIINMDDIDFGSIFACKMHSVCLGDQELWNADNIPKE